MVEYHIAGFSTCHFYKKASAAGTAYQEGKDGVTVVLHASPTRDEYKAKLPELREPLNDDRANGHTSSPFVWKSENGVLTFVGGCDDFLAEINA